MLLYKRIKHAKKATILFLAILLLVYTFQFYNIALLPSEIDIIKGETKNLNIVYPFTLGIIQEQNNILSIDENVSKLGLSLINSYNFQCLTEGIAKVEYKLFGLIPIKDIKVNVKDRLYVIPGGHSIGVKVNTQGVLVVALSDVMGQDGKDYNPAKSAGIRVGDIILEINKTQIKNTKQIINLLTDLENESLYIKIKRDDKIIDKKVKPVKSKQDNCYRIGIWVRDRTAGIGTLTFYEPNSKTFGALGHGIIDVDTSKLIPVSKGEIMQARVSSIELGKKGTPGEIRGIFFESENVLGKVDKNTFYGIYGTAVKEIDNKLYSVPIPIATQREIKEGKAYILTTTDRREINRYEIEILKKESQSQPSQKSMIIKVTDNDLLRKTGGIVQGMSGSPIIQNGKLIGAVTHVFVNDPTKGYGIYIEWMIKNSEIHNINKNDFAEAN